MTLSNSAGSVRKARYIFASYFYVIGVITQVRPRENDDLSFIFTLFVPWSYDYVEKISESGVLRLKRLL